MKTAKINVYEYEELSPEAQEKAFDKWNEHNDMPLLQSMLNDECNELTRVAGMTCTSNHPVCLYSLSNSQGDGLMFEGSFDWNGIKIKVKHSGRYYHSKSRDIGYTDENGDELPDDAKTDALVHNFESIYETICVKLKKLGYDMIEDETSEAHFIDKCNANEWTFTEDGRMLNV